MEVLNPAQIISLGPKTLINNSNCKTTMVEPMYSSLDNLNVSLPATTNSPQQSDLKMLGGNSLSLDNLENGDCLCEYVGNFNIVPNIPLNVMPPPPHTLTNGNGVRAGRDYWNLRSNSPHGSESDESLRSYKSREGQCVRMKGGATKNGYQTYYNQNLVYGKYSSTPSVFFASSQPTSAHKHKNRYSIGRVRRDNKHQQPQDINRRVYGLMERFTSKAKLFRIVPNPPKLLCGGSWDQLNQSMWDVYTAKAQKEQTYMRKLELWRMLYIHINVRTLNKK